MTSSGQGPPPFVQMTLDVRDILSSFKGCTSTVFQALGLFLLDPVAPSIKDICDLFNLSRPAVSQALEFLCKNHFAHCLVDEEGVRRYTPDQKYFRCGVPNSVAVREKAPVLEPARVIPDQKGDVNIFFTRQSAAVAIEERLIPDSYLHKEQQQQILPELRLALSESYPQVGEPLRSKCLRGVTPDKYREWFEEWVPNAPDRFRDPPVFAATQLACDPQAVPPERKHKGNLNFTPSHCLRRSDFEDWEWNRMDEQARERILRNEVIENEGGE